MTYLLLIINTILIIFIIRFVIREFLSVSPKSEKAFKNILQAVFIFIALFCMSVALLCEVSNFNIIYNLNALNKSNNNVSVNGSSEYELLKAILDKTTNELIRCTIIGFLSYGIASITNKNIKKEFFMRKSLGKWNLK